MEIMNIKILNTAIENILNRDFAEFDITYTQATVIGFLNQHNGEEICQRDIENALGLSHPTMSSILKRLDEKKLIRTEALATDRRYKRAELTDSSKKMVDTIQQKINSINERLTQGLSQTEEEEFERVMNVMIQNTK
ncbi:MAG: MarR family transcriptional regulator [Erysipelotrichaceae bacterium]|nr:MarR family transcriptional regulator [Erysipelotrichaceae bacterium]